MLMCAVSMTVVTLLQVLFIGDVDRKMLGIQLDIKLKNELTSGADYIACPTPDCEQYLVKPSGDGGTAETTRRRHRVDCPGCHHSFCSECKGQMHYAGTMCDSVEAITAQYHTWMLTGQ